MTVRELVEKLQATDQEAMIIIPDNDGWYDEIKKVVSEKVSTTEINNCDINNCDGVGNEINCVLLVRWY